MKRNESIEESQCHLVRECVELFLQVLDEFWFGSLCSAWKRASKSPLLSLLCIAIFIININLIYYYNN